MTCSTPTEVLAVLYQDLQAHKKERYLEKALCYSERDYSVIRQRSLQCGDPFHGAELFTGFFQGNLPLKVLGLPWSHGRGTQENRAGGGAGTTAEALGEAGRERGTGRLVAWVLPTESLWFNKIRSPWKCSGDM